MFMQGISEGCHSKASVPDNMSDGRIVEVTREKITIIQFECR
jgi:hypothetical protein